MIQQKTIRRVAGVSAGLLLIPLVAMQFTAEVDWGPGDFVVMGALLLGTGIMMALAWRRLASPARLAVVVALAGLFLYVWAELAVGLLFGPST